jgi:hypothetical protein
MKFTLHDTFNDPENPMKTHTPGPWLATPTTAISRNPDSLRMDIVTTTGEWTPAFIAGDILPEDASLIASAPDLLSALEAVTKAYVELVQSDYPPSWNAEKNSEVIAARKAIAKATGNNA